MASYSMESALQGRSSHAPLFLFFASPLSPLRLLAQIGPSICEQRVCGGGPGHRPGKTLYILYS